MWGYPGAQNKFTAIVSVAAFAVGAIRPQAACINMTPPTQTWPTETDCVAGVRGLEVRRETGKE
jgi:hypothetical protein